jgi:excisionase family DNA binding protein
MTDNQLLLRLPEAAARAGVGATTLRQLIRSGRVSVVRIGRRGVRVPATALDEWVMRETQTKATKVVGPEQNEAWGPCARERARTSHALGPGRGDAEKGS